MSHTRVRIAVALGVAVVGTAGWAATPAPASRYIPEPVEFGASLPVRPAAAVRASGPVVTTRVVRPGKRFNLVGLSWRRARIERLAFRVRPDAGRWSRWAAVATDSDHGPDRRTAEARRGRRASDPLWAGQADRVQVRMWGVKGARGLRLRFVNTTGTATAFDRMDTRLRRAVAADNSQPAIVPRAAWGADKCPPRANPAYGTVQLAFVHHTVSANDYGPEDSAAMVLGICRYHRNTNGWNDIGYNFIVDRYGTIFEGRAGGVGEAVVGAQAQGFNSSSTGIASLGTFSSGGQTPAGLGALARLLGWKLAVHGVPPTGRVQVVSAGGSTNRYPTGSRASFERISGHRDGNATACPGDGLYAQLPTLRDMVDPGPPRAATATRAARERRNVSYGKKAALRVSLAAGDTALGGRPVEVQVLGRLGWRKRHTLRTDAAGNAVTRMRLSINRTLRARYSGEPGFLPSSSPALAVGVRPRVKASVGTSGDAAFPAGSLVRVRGSVRPRKRSASLTIMRTTASGALVRALRKTVKLRRGRLSTRVRIRRRGEYRLRLSVRKDGRNLSARSTWVPFRVG